MNLKYIFLATTLIIGLYSCNTKPESGDQLDNSSVIEKDITTPVDKPFSLTINESLVQEFYFDSVINLANPEIKSNLIDRLLFDLDRDNELDTISLYQIAQLENDPGDFHRIEILMANGENIDQMNFDGWIRSNKYMPTINNIDSELISIVSHEDFTILMCYGWYYASDPPQLTIFEFSTGIPRVVFHQNFAIKELILDSNLILIGEKYYQELESSQPELFDLKLINNSLILASSNNH